MIYPVTERLKYLIFSKKILGGVILAGERSGKALVLEFRTESVVSGSPGARRFVGVDGKPQTKGSIK